VVRVRVFVLIAFVLGLAVVVVVLVAVCYLGFLQIMTLSVPYVVGNITLGLTGGSAGSDVPVRQGYGRLRCVNQQLHPYHYRTIF
jgi:hypothetical protein